MIINRLPFENFNSNTKANNFGVLGQTLLLTRRLVFLGISFEIERQRWTARREVL